MLLKVPDAGVKRNTIMQVGCISWRASFSISCDMYPMHNSDCEAVACTKLTLVTHTSPICDCESYCEKYLMLGSTETKLRGGAFHGRGA